MPSELVDARIEVIEGDLPGVPELPADLDVVVHCAGDVSFDPPIDQAFTTNVIGTKALLDRILQAVTDADGVRTKVPHYVHISTAYTAGRRRGSDPGSSARARGRLRRRDPGRAGDAGPDRGRVADLRPAGQAAQGGRAAAPAGRLSHHRRRHGAPPDRLGAGRTGQGGHRARPVARLDRCVHVHQGARRAGGRRRRRGTSISRWSARRSSSRRGSIRIRGGSRASRWPSR